MCILWTLSQYRYSAHCPVRRNPGKTGTHCSIVIKSNAMAHCPPLSLHLADVASRLKSRRSAEYARLTIIAETAKLSASHDLTNLKVPQICESCGISRATFYLHFQSRDELFAELMRELTALESANIPSLADCTTIESAIEQIIDWYIDVHLANASLFQNLTFLRRSNRAISDSWLIRAKTLHEAVVRELSRFSEFKKLDPGHANFVLEFVGGGMNSVISRVNTRLPTNPFVPSRLADIKKTVSQLLFRALFGADPAYTTKKGARQLHISDDRSQSTEVVTALPSRRQSRASASKRRAGKK